MVYTPRRKAQFNFVFSIPNSFEGRAFLKQARHYLNRTSYRLTAVATAPLDGKRGKNAVVKQKNARTLNIYTYFKNGRTRPMGVKGIKRLRHEVNAQDGLVGELINEIERLEGEVRVLQSDQQHQRTGLLAAVRNRLNAVSKR